MNTKLGVPVLAFALTLSGAMTFTAQAQNSPRSQSTVFECVKEQSSGNFTTVANRGSKTSTPLIVWTSTLNSDNSESSYTPARRCNAVSKSLTDLVASVGQGNLKNLWLDYKPVNSQVVICVYHTAQAACTTRNVVFTRKPENRPLAAEILANLKEFSQRGSGSPIYESEDDSEATPTRAVSLEAWSNQAFASQSGASSVNGSSSKNSPSSGF